MVVLQTLGTVGTMEHARVSLWHEACWLEFVFATCLFQDALRRELGFQALGSSGQQGSLLSSSHARTYQHRGQLQALTGQAMSLLKGHLVPGDWENEPT